MSRRWLGLLLLGIWIGHVRVAHAAITASPTTVNVEVRLGAGQSGTGTTTISSTDPAVLDFSFAGTGCGAFDIETGATDVTVGPGDDEVTTRSCGCDSRREPPPG